MGPVFLSVAHTTPRSLGPTLSLPCHATCCSWTLKPLSHTLHDSTCTLPCDLQELDPEVTSHVQHQIGCPPAAMALPWITSGFVGYLPVQEVLLLWDRVIGLDSLLPLAVLAVAVVCFR